eukprot:RCo018023
MSRDFHGTSVFLAVLLGLLWESLPVGALPRSEAGLPSPLAASSFSSQHRRAWETSLPSNQLCESFTCPTSLLPNVSHVCAQGPCTSSDCCVSVSGCNISLSGRVGYGAEINGAYVLSGLYQGHGFFLQQRFKSLPLVLFALSWVDHSPHPWVSLAARLQRHECLHARPPPLNLVDGVERLDHRRRPAGADPLHRARPRRPFEVSAEGAGL